MYLCILFVSFFFMSFSFSLLIHTSHALFFHTYHFSLFPSHFLCSFFSVHSLYIFRSFCLMCYSTSFLSVFFLRIQILWSVTLCHWSVGPAILLYPIAVNQLPRHSVATMNTSSLRNMTPWTSIQSLCFNSCFFVSCLLFSFWKQHLFWEINVTFSTSRILSKVPKSKNCPVYLVPDHSSCTGQKAWISPTDLVTPTVLSYTLKQTDTLWWCWMYASQCTGVLISP